MRRLALAVVVWGSQWGCGPQPQSSAVKQEHEERSPDPQAVPDGEGESTGRVELREALQLPGVVWHDGGLEAARQEAEREGKLLLVDVGAYWCTPCHELHESLFSDPVVARYLREHFVVVQVDAEKEDGPEFVERYGVGGYPAILVLDPEWGERGRVTEVFEAPAFVERIESLRRAGDPLPARRAAIELRPDSLSRRLALARALLAAGQGELAATEYEAVLVADPVNASGFAVRVGLDRARSLEWKASRLESGRAEAFGRARAAYVELGRRYPGSRAAAWIVSGVARSGLGASRAQQGRGAPAGEALAGLEERISAAPEDPSARAALGWFVLRHGLAPEGALAHLVQALELEPKSAELWELQGRLQLRAGATPGAGRESLERALELEPRSERVRRLLAAPRDRGGGSP